VVVKLPVIIMAAEEVRGKQGENINDVDEENSECIKGEGREKIAMTKDGLEEVQTEDVGELGDYMD
jgi:hypothetical protein